MDADEFLQHACLTYSPLDDPKRFERAKQALAELDADTRSIAAVAAAIGDATALKAALATDPGAARDPYEPSGWEPLLYLCYSRVLCEDADPLACAQMLIDAGASPNAHWMWGSTYRFTTLTGVFGEGEKGARVCPPHPAGHALARVLLDAGANPNDGQGLYNTMFTTTGDDVLELLLEYGFGPSDRINWVGSESLSTFEYQAANACNKGHATRLALLLKHGLDPKASTEDGQSLWELAWRKGHRAMAEMLAEAGAQPVELSVVDQMMAAIRAEAIEEVEALDTPETRTALLTQYPSALSDAAGEANIAAIDVLLSLGFPIEPEGEASPLHHAAWTGDLATCQRLVQAGADLTRTDSTYNARPAGWAFQAGHMDAARWLTTAAAAL